MKPGVATFPTATEVADAKRRYGVSRETCDRLRLYAQTLLAWQDAINLVAASTVPHLWQRHYLDSLQLLPLLPPTARTVVDMGSGAGFPGLALAVCTNLEVHLIEANHKKCAFLREAARVTKARVVIHSARVEQVAPFPADVITARAVAPLTRLLDLAQPFVDAQTTCLFPKGQSVEVEVTDARTLWSFRDSRHLSITAAGATVLQLREIHREQYPPRHSGCQPEGRRRQNNHRH